MWRAAPDADSCIVTTESCISGRAGAERSGEPWASGGAVESSGGWIQRLPACPDDHGRSGEAPAKHIGPVSAGAPCAAPPSSRGISLSTCPPLDLPSLHRRAISIHVLLASCAPASSTRTPPARRSPKMQAQAKVGAAFVNGQTRVGSLPAAQEQGRRQEEVHLHQCTTPLPAQPVLGASRSSARRRSPVSPAPCGAPRCRRLAPPAVPPRLSAWRCRSVLPRLGGGQRRRGEAAAWCDSPGTATLDQATH